MGGVKYGSWFKVLNRFNQLEVVQRRNVNYCSGVRNVSGYVHDNKWMYPVLAAPLEGKNVDAMTCPSEHIEVTKGFLRRVAKS